MHRKGVTAALITYWCAAATTGQRTTSSAFVQQSIPTFTSRNLGEAARHDGPSAISRRHAIAAKAGRGRRGAGTAHAVTAWFSLRDGVGMPSQGWRCHEMTSVSSRRLSALNAATGAELTPPSNARVGAGADPVAKKASTARVAFYLAVWYSFTIGYNVYNKATLNRISIPWILSTVQLAIGAVYISVIWLTGVRKAPKLNMENVKTVAPLAVLHTVAHIAAVISLSAGAIGYFQIVKAGEPLFTALFSGLLLNQVFAWPVYASLLPVVGGVAVASMKELTFNWISFGGAMTSNVASAARGVLAKVSMDKPKGENMDAGNIYGVMTIMATLMLAPFAWAVEGSKFNGLWAAAMAAGHTKFSIVKGTVLSGVFFYMYNEVAFYCLNAIHPVTHAVANTLKRVFLLAVSIAVFGHRLTPVGAAGSGVAIGGVLLYSLARQNFGMRKSK